MRRQNMDLRDLSLSLIHILEVLNDSQSLLARTEQSVKNAGKQLDKSVKKQVKADITRLRKLVVKCRLDRVTETCLLYTSRCV